MGVIKLLILCLFFSVSCGGRAPMDEYCDEQCSIEYETEVAGTWMGNDSFWNATRCLCQPPGSDPVYHMFPLRQPKR